MGLLLCPPAQLEDLEHVAGALIQAQFATVQAVDHRVVPVGAERPVDLLEVADHRCPGSPPVAAVGVPAAQGQADRHPHQVHNMPVNAVGLVGECGAHIPAWSRADCSDCRYPVLVTVAPLTMSIVALCALTVSCTRIGSARALICWSLLFPCGYCSTSTAV